jgi:hypothetical protein
MSFRFAVVYEAAGDFEIATGLADRVISDSHFWLIDCLDMHRDWLSQSPTRFDFTWKNMRSMAEALEVPDSFGPVDGLPREIFADRALRAIRVVLKAFEDERPDAIVLVHDQEDVPERRAGMDQARQAELQRNPGMKIVVGLPMFEQEAWILCGFVPEDDQEHETLRALHQELGRHPCERSHELTAGSDNNAKNSPKRVLEVLTRNDPAREKRCWAEAALADLRRHGAENGLVAYLDEVHMHLASLFGHVKP